MTEIDAIDAAAKRLQAALDALEAAVEQRLEHDQGRAALQAQVHAFEADRARLACELDAAASRARQLESAQREVARRLDSAIEAIRALVTEQDR